MSALKPDRRTQIRSAAIRLVADNGVGAMTTRNVAREANLHLSTLHYFYGTKEAIALAVLESITDAIASAIVQAACGNLSRRSLEQIVNDVRAFVERQPRLILSRNELLLWLGQVPDCAEQVNQLHERYLDALGGLYDEVGPETSLAVPREAFVQLVAALILGTAVDAVRASHGAQRQPGDGEPCTDAFSLLARLCAEPRGNEPVTG